MLRLRTSELTLIPDDIDETFRRMALRQRTRLRTGLPPGRPAQPGRPILRPGPQRLTRDAVTALGSIPILQPQVAAITSAEEEFLEDAYQEVSPATEHALRERPVSPRSQRETPLRIDSIQPPASPASVVQSLPSPTLSLPLPESPPRRSLHGVLPFRFGRSRRPSTTQSQPDTVVSVARTPTRSPLGHARLDSTRASSIGDTSNSSTISPAGDSTESSTGLRGGGRARDVREPPNAPSPLHHMLRLSSPEHEEPSGDPTKSPTTPREDQPTLYLEGYWHHTPRGDEYRMRKSTEDRFWRRPPHSEPRRVSGRQDSIMRSLSSGSAPSLLTNRSRPPSGLPFDDVFSTLPTDEPRSRRNASDFTASCNDYYSTSSDIFRTPGGSLQPEQTNSRPRHFSSDASGASGQFSYYGSLPPSRGASSGGPSIENDLSRSQMDGAVASNEDHRPLAPAVPSSVSRHSTNRPNSSGSSILSFSDNIGSGPHGVSPLPSMPYTRNQGDSTSSDYTTQRSGYIVDATTAAMEGLESPLNPFSEHYQRQLQAARARMNPYTYRPRAEGPQARRSSQGHGDRANHSRHPPPLLDQRTGSSRQAYYRAQEFQQSFENLAIDESKNHEWGSNLHGRGGRGDRHSREDPSSMPTSSSDATMRAGGVQAQRAAYERLHNSRMAMQVETNMNPLRHSIPQPTITHDAPGRRHHFTGFRNEEHRNSPFNTYRRPSHSQMAHPLGGPRGGEPDDIFQASYPQSASSVPQRAYRPMPSARYLNPRLTRDSPLTALALDQGSGTTSRRSLDPLVRATTMARTHRRVPPEQRDQENDGDREAMEREREGINSRYGDEEGGRSRMDETPPRIGRVERRMREGDRDREGGVRDV
ncbi:hypothetical protein GT037_008296 [Alternaria burnsii]|uniref:Uncharacterized protein n=1 Tax=Alternaria burnsii TaxID=1187904 RepID=A0A8H7AZQ0_9PLEO|nr:uncharacterized protein GT037_008296 [Alternaria burnsii]KAF7673681.1 hypothetical protein GT037_008296 [Alternaria burnsii]